MKKLIGIIIGGAIIALAFNMAFSPDPNLNWAMRGIGFIATLGGVFYIFQNKLDL